MNKQARDSQRRTPLLVCLSLRCLSTALCVHAIEQTLARLLSMRRVFYNVSCSDVWHVAHWQRTAQTRAGRGRGASRAHLPFTCERARTHRHIRQSILFPRTTRHTAWLGGAAVYLPSTNNAAVAVHIDFENATRGCMRRRCGRCEIAREHNKKNNTSESHQGSSVRCIL